MRTLTEPVMCLTDRMLWRISEGDGGAEERDHLAHCGLCRERAGELNDDLGTVAWVLRDVPPAGSVEVVPRPHHVWIPAAAMVIVLVLMLWSVHRVPPSTSEDGVAALGELSATVFADDDEPIRATDVSVLAAAFER